MQEGLQHALMLLSTDDKSKYTRYQARPPTTLATFLAAVHKGPEDAKEVKWITFSLPGDTIENSGIVEFLNGVAPSDPDNVAQTPLQELSARLKALQSAYSTDGAATQPLSPADLAKVPFKFILEIYVDAFLLVCPNVEIVQFPLAWIPHLERITAKWGERLGCDTLPQVGTEFVTLGKAVVIGKDGRPAVDHNYGKGAAA